MNVEHDPLCNNQPEHFDGSILWPERCTCDLLAKVRADEREKAAQLIARMCDTNLRLLTAPERQVLDNAIAAVRGES